MIKTVFKNPYLAVVLAIAVVALALVAIPRMPVDLLPQFRKSAMQILTLYPGMPAEVVEKDITSRMERWTGQSPGIEKQISKSIMGVSLVTNYYGADVEPAEAMANASSYAMSDMYYQPPGTLPPMIQPFDPTASKPLLLLTVSSDTKSGKELYDVAYYALRQMLSGVPGIIAPAAYGGALRRIHIYVDPVRLQALGISQTEVNEAIQRNTTMIPSGIARIGPLNWSIDARGMLQNVDEFNDIVVAMRDGKPVFVRDVGHAADASAIQTNLVRVDGREQVYLPVFKRSKANTIASVEAVKAALPSLRERLPADVKLEVVFDQSAYVREAISGLAWAGGGGLVLVALVLMLFLGDARASFIALLALPLAALTGFLVLWGAGQSINSITLGGMALVLGLLVDNAIVVLENIDRHRRMGKSAEQAAYEATVEVALPILASTLVIIVVFFPVVFLSGIARDLFTPLAITVAGAMLGSYVFSLTVVPLAAARLFRNRPLREATDPKRFERVLNGWRAGYARLLQRVLLRKRLVLLSTLVVFALSLLLLGRSGFELFPSSDVGQMEISVRRASGTSLRDMEVTIARMEAAIRAELGADLRQVISNIGVFYDLPAAYTPNSGTQDAFIGVQLTGAHAIGTAEYARRVRERFRQEFPGVEIAFDTGGLITAALNEGKSAPIDVQVKGNDLKVLHTIAERVRDTLATVPGIVDVRILQRIDAPAKQVEVDRAKAALLGVDPVDAIKNLVSALNSSATYDKAFWIDEKNGNHYFVGVTYPEALIDAEEVLENVTVMGAHGAVPYRAFATIKETSHPVEVNHHQLGRVFNVYASVDGTDAGRASSRIQSLLDDMPLPTGYSIAFQGEVAAMRSSFGDLGLGLVLAVLMVFLIIVPLFRSFRLPLIILASFPLGLIGVALLMWATGTRLNIQSVMGIIMIVGISVSYGNILVDRMAALVRDGRSVSEAIRQGTADRFRPLLMTAGTTVFGLLPTALALGTGGEVNAPLAVAVIGGTIAATLLALFITPILFALLVKPRINTP
ncbi:MAG TPA: efflux RND transporter permease subunit [Flavobacteriales bacterium]|nr:efflux RND transporter permease subunit [Flavobacteriales bacterium]HMR28696.1 efflux RND transporter permease subunit [Flavobacteriales bacterium]